MLIKKNRFKRNKKMKHRSIDEFRAGSIKITLNKRQTDDSSNNNENSNNDSNHNNNNSNNNKNNSNDYNHNHNNSNNNNNNIHNIKNILNTRSNSSTLPGNIVVINNSQISNNHVMSGMPLFNVVKNKNHESLNRQNLSLSYDKNKIILSSVSNTNEVIVNTTSDDEINEPPPEYTEYSKSDLKRQFM